MSFHCCRLHYKEYLVSEINRSHIDPVDAFDLDELQVVYGRKQQTMPKRKDRESDANFRRRLQQVRVVARDRFVRGWTLTSAYRPLTAS